MKKFFIALSVLAALLLGVAPSQALVGMPDDMPGADATIPFICSTDITTGTGLNTLIAFTEVGRGQAGSTADRSLSYYYDICTVRSVTVYDSTITGTAGSVTSMNAKTEVSKVADTLLPDLEVTIAGVTYYAGYFHFASRNLVAATSQADIIANNNVLAQVLFVNLAAGKVGGTNLPMREYNNNLASSVYGTVASAGQTNMAPATGAANDYIEKFSPDALASAMALQEVGTPIANQATFFGLYPRFYIPASGDSNWIINWQCENGTTATGAVASNGLGSMHINIYNKDERARSTTVRWPNEMNIIDVEDWLPKDIFTAYPKEGWFDFRWDNVTAGTFPDVADIRDITIFGWNYMITSGTAQEAWTVMNNMPRRARFDNY
jgi:hypothetical protein